MNRSNYFHLVQKQLLLTHLHRYNSIVSLTYYYAATAIHTWFPTVLFTLSACQSILAPLRSLCVILRFAVSPPQVVVIKISAVTMKTVLQSCPPFGPGRLLMGWRLRFPFVLSNQSLHVLSPWIPSSTFPSVKNCTSSPLVPLAATGCTSLVRTTNQLTTPTSFLVVAPTPR